MSDNASNNSLTSSNFQADTTKYSSSKTADPETASIATVSSSTPLVKKEEKKEKNGTEIDVKKLQERALKSQIRFNSGLEWGSGTDLKIERKMKGIFWLYMGLAIALVK
ncbi:hypothetical protein FLAG1_03584 [Fusarium langsethiae]|uniref:Uncharacterized protein n=1 Tax=Fusarium langsethiae TaxID=179993 RepID=A0A0N0V7P0_FUSLA|nr:hypothetical protein FLAG1_03584 [Fusarium langsethiae]GKU01345.1 unnamed protein product [Fusarium langsethiae]GKU16714.1 unnamed protein product [Fusarium langsethiae]